MAACIDGIFDTETKKKINECKLLLVGAGGIGCELLKALVETRFENIHVIDLDTIDLSNLNRQFLFHKQHIGRPKAVVAKESALKFNPKANITAYHDSITNPKYNVEFYQQFTAVVNALDNIGARSHVNRMCIAADRPLIDSGSAGYRGNVTVYKRKMTECYECVQRKPPKTYPGCTIRNTPSEPVHCIVWAKHLFNQLFGESDEEDQVAPDVSLSETEIKSDNIPPAEKFCTREWAKSTDYDPHKLFQKLFNEDILYLISMKDLWEKRRTPRPLKFDELPDAVASSSQTRESEIQDFRTWSVKECGEMFVKSLHELRKRVANGEPDSLLVWDKDDDVCMDFVAACSNLRSYCFHIQMKSKFDVKAIAGNIIPAVATTNAIVSGLVVLELMKIVKGEVETCKQAFINESYYSTNKLITALSLSKANSKCVVCSAASTEVTVNVNIKTFTLKNLEEKVLKEKIHMVQPDAFIYDGTGSIVISSDPDEMSEEMYEQPLSSFKIDSHSRLVCEDFLQNFKIILIIVQDDSLSNQEFVIASDVDNIKKDDDSNAKAGTSNDVDKEPQEDSSDWLMDDGDILISDDENGMEPPAKKMKI